MPAKSTNTTPVTPEDPFTPETLDDEQDTDISGGSSAPEVDPESGPEEDAERAAYERWRAAQRPADAGEYRYVQMPDGSIRAIRVSDIEGASAGSDEEQPDVYIHLANGDVERVNASELPGTSGADNPHGHYVKDGKTHTIIGVHPVETDVPEGK